MPAGSLVTSPLSALTPSSSSENRTPSVSGANVPTIEVYPWSSLTVHDPPAPGQSGVLQPKKLFPASGLAISLTSRPAGNFHSHEPWPWLAVHGSVTGWPSWSTPAGSVLIEPG